MATALTARPEWQALLAHYEKQKSVHLRELFVSFPRSFDVECEFVARSVFEQMEVFEIGLACRLSAHLLKLCPLV